MHRHVTHNRSHPSYNHFCRSVLHFLRVEVPKNWAVFCDSVTDNFRVINPPIFGFEGVGVSKQFTLSPNWPQPYMQVI